MNTKDVISFDEINQIDRKEISDVAAQVLAETITDKSKVEFRPRGIFKAGIRTNIKFVSMTVNDQYNSLDLVFRDEKAGAVCNSRIYPANPEFYKGDKKAHQRAYLNKIKLVYSLLNAAKYPETYNVSLIDIEEWGTFIRQIVEVFNKINSGDTLIAGVFVVNKSGYVQLRQSFRTNICNMKELDKNAVQAEEFFHIDEQYDNFELPEDDDEDDGTSDISPISGVKYKKFPKDHPLYNNGIDKRKDIKLEEEE